MVFVCVVFLSNPDLEDPEDRTVETVFSGNFSELESIPGVSRTPPPPQFCERAYGDVACLWMCVLFNFFFVCLHVCVRMPLSLRSITGVPSSRALPGFPITAHHLCAFLM